MTLLDALIEALHRRNHPASVRVTCQVCRHDTGAILAHPAMKVIAEKVALAEAVESLRDRIEFDYYDGPGLREAIDAALSEEAKR